MLPKPTRRPLPPALPTLTPSWSVCPAISGKRFGLRAFCLEVWVCGSVHGSEFSRRPQAGHKRKKKQEPQCSSGTKASVYMQYHCRLQYPYYSIHTLIRPHAAIVSVYRNTTSALYFFSPQSSQPGSSFFGDGISRRKTWQRRVQDFQDSGVF